jgi:hypothetical protein
MPQRLKHEMDGYVVEYVAGQGWTCECEEFFLAGSCQHAIDAEALESLERAHAQRWTRARGPKETLH